MKLTPSQTLLLSAASNHPEQLLADFPAHLKGGALIKVLTSLGNAGLITPHSKTAQGNTCFAITAAGYEALGLTQRAPITLARLEAVIANAQASADADADADAEGSVDFEVKPVRTREGSKQATVIAMLKRTEGATIAQICEATGWQSHTVRGTMAGALKKKLALSITSTKEQGADRTYRAA